MQNRRSAPRLLFAIALIALFPALHLAHNSLAFAQSLGPPPSAPGVPSGAPVTTLAPLAAPAAPAPAAVTSPAAAAPGAPGALATTSALPVLNPAPIVIGAQATPVPQTLFRCSCFGVGLGTQWIGQVAASSFTSASQSAKGQCNAYTANTNVGSPYITPPGAPSLGRSVFPTVNPNAAPGDVATQRASSALIQVPAATIARAQSGSCARCACN